MVLRGTALYEKPFFFLYLRRLTVFVPWEGAALVLRRDEAWLEARVEAMRKLAAAERERPYSAWDERSSLCS